MGVRAGGAAGAVFFLTDYGQADELAGVVRAVLARLAPGAPVVDLTHEVPPFDVRAGALALERAAPHLGPGVVLGVVDPGVGSPRRAVAVGLAGGERPRALVGPDNGLLGPAADALGGATGAVVLPRAAGEDQVTFDGRDVFAPAAAALWRGEALDALGEPLDPADLVRLAPPVLEVGEASLRAEVLWVDRFGNVQLAATAADGRAVGAVPGCRVEVEVATGGPEEGASRRVPARMVRAFADLAGAQTAAPELGLLVDANGRLALVCDRSPAATVLGVRSGDVVVVDVAAPPGGRGAGG
jgi:S-adenosylmethionine hydrolase